MSEAVKVMVRVRPMSEGEKNRGCKNNIDIDEKTHSLVLHKKGWFHIQVQMTLMEANNSHLIMSFQLHPLSNTSMNKQRFHSSSQ